MPGLIVTASPHLKAPASTPVIMWTVVASMVPIVAASFYFFGISALLVIAASVAGAFRWGDAVTMRPGIRRSPLRAAARACSPERAG